MKYKPTVYYLSPVRMEEMPNAGIRKKVWGQLDACRELGYRPVLIYLRQDGLVLTDGQREQRVIPLPAVHRLIRQWSYYDYVASLLPEVFSADYAYLRYHVPTPAYLRILKSINALPEAKRPRVYCEVPTYPYTQEFRGLKGKAFTWLDQRYAQRAGAYYDRVLTFYPAVKIFGQRPQLLENAVAQSIIEEGRRMVAGDDSVRDPNRLHVIGLAANLEAFHGYERALAGLKTYVAERTPAQPEIYLTIISQGAEFERLRQLAADWSLGEYTRFLAPRVGQELYEIMVTMDVGLGTLARYLVNLETDSSLKSREYCCFGVPLVLSATDRSFPASLPFVNYVPNDGSELRMNDLVRWLQELRRAPNWRRQLLAYARHTLSWQAQMSRVLPALTASKPTP